MYSQSILDIQWNKNTVNYYTANNQSTSINMDTL